jgi:hypothetical protein
VHISGAPPSSPAARARGLVRRGLKGALATLDRRNGGPFASLVTFASEPGGAPIFLISRLAHHTQNLAADARASLLVDGTDGLGDPLSGGRVSLAGRITPTTHPNARRRFLARHASAAQYADFADFGFFRLEIERGHFVGGFGRIDELAATDLLIDVAGAEDLAEAEVTLLEAINREFGRDLERLAAAQGAEPTGGTPWRATGIDPEGLDLLAGTAAARIVFPRLIGSAAQFHAVFEELRGA